MTNQQLKAHCRDVIASPQDHLDWVVDMARVALASLEAPRHQLKLQRINVAGRSYSAWRDSRAVEVKHG